MLGCISVQFTGLESELLGLVADSVRKNITVQIFSYFILYTQLKKSSSDFAESSLARQRLPTEETQAVLLFLLVSPVVPVGLLLVRRETPQSILRSCRYRRGSWRRRRW